MGEYGVIWWFLVFPMGGLMTIAVVVALYEAWRDRDGL